MEQLQQNITMTAVYLDDSIVSVLIPEGSNCKRAPPKMPGSTTGRKEGRKEHIYLTKRQYNTYLWKCNGQETVAKAKHSR